MTNTKREGEETVWAELNNILDVLKTEWPIAEIKLRGAVIDLIAERDKWRALADTLAKDLKRILEFKGLSDIHAIAKAGVEEFEKMGESLFLEDHTLEHRNKRLAELDEDSIS